MKLKEIGRLGHWVDTARLNEQSVIVDAGACTGEFIEEIRKYVFCKILAIEPDPDNFKTLKDKQFPKVDLYNNALVGNSEQPFSFFYTYPQREIGNLFELYPGKNERIGIKTIKLKDLMQRKIDYLKLDIEGAERDLFDQMTDRDVINVQQLCVEIHKNTDKDKVVQKLIDFGFVVEEMPRCEIYAYRTPALKHDYAPFPEPIKMDGRVVRDYSQIWTLDWFRENVFKYIKGGESVLDAGCGNGRMMKIFPEYFKRFVGIDVFEYGDTLYDLYDRHIIGDYEEYDFSEKFDCICFFATLYQMRNKVGAIRKAKELLKPNGQIVVMDGAQRQANDGGFHSYSLEDICEKLGLSCKKVEEINEVFVKICEQL